MIKTTIPSVLFDPAGSISTERALNQILGLLLEFLDIAQTATMQDALSASISDVELMLASIER